MSPQRSRISPAAGRAPLQGLLALACASILPTGAKAQRLLVPHDSPRAMVALVDVSAGALFDSAWIDVDATAVPPLTSSNVLSHAERVRDEVWVAGGQFVYRYDVGTRAYLGSFAALASVRSIDPQPGRVVLTTIDRVESRTFDGGFIEEFPIEDASDTLDLGDGTMLVARRAEARVDRFTRDGTFLSVFAGPSVPTPFGVLSRPQQLALDRGGRVLVCGDVRAYIFEADGTFVDEIDAGPFEGGVSSTYAGWLFIPLGTGMALHDPVTGATATIGGPFFGEGRKVGLLDRGDPGSLEPGEASSSMTCEGSVNSTGRQARVAVLGSSLATDRLFGLFGDRLPPGAPVIPLLSRVSTPLPFAGGALCLDRRVILTPLAPLAADSLGTVEAGLVRGPSAVIAPLPGSTLHLQLLYRDGPRTLISDAARVTFSD